MKKIVVGIVFVCAIGISFTSCKEGEKEVKKVEVVKGKKNAVTDVYQCPMDCEKGKTYDKAGSCPVCKMDLKKKKITADVYQCPMDCEKGKTHDKPGSCSVCKMDLKKKEVKDSDDGHGHGHKH